MVSPGDIYRIQSGQFAGFEAKVVSVDDTGIDLGIDLFGRETRVRLSLDQLADIAEPFADVAPIHQTPDADEVAAWFRRENPSAMAIYSTRWGVSSIRLSHSGTDISLTVSTLDLTRAYGTGSQNVETYAACTENWEALNALLREVDFWNLPHDDGRRFTSEQKPRRYTFEGWDGDRYHSLERRTLSSTRIAKACQFLVRLAVDADEDLRYRLNPPLLDLD